MIIYKQIIVIMEEIEIKQKGTGLLHSKFYPYNVLIIVFSLYFLGASLFSIFKIILPENLNTNFDIYTQGISQLLFLLLPTILFSKKALLPFKEILRFKFTLNWNIILLSLFGVLSLQLLTTGIIVTQEHLIPSWLLPSYRIFEEYLEKIYSTLFSGRSAMDLFLALMIGALIPAISEELLFRGFFQKTLEQKMKPLNAILITSLIFSLLHFNPINFVSLIIIGSYLGFLAYISNSIYLPMLIHLINNIISILFLFNPYLSKIEDNYTTIPFFEGLILLLLGLFLTFASCYLILKLNKTELETST